MGRHKAPKVRKSPVSWIADALRSEAKRKAIYTVVTAVLGALAAWGVLSADDVAQYGEAAASLLGALAMFLARANTSNGDAADEALATSNETLFVEAMEGDVGSDA